MKYSINIRKVRSMQKKINLLIKKSLPGALLDHYGGLIRHGDEFLVVHTDGVGTKILVAQELGKYDTIGIDAIAMNVNDIICLGAEPLCGVDYLALAKEDEELVCDIMKGLFKGANEADIMIIGGETAVVPELIHGGKRPFDLSFTAIGTLKRPITGEKIRAGDIIVGLESAGLHSNGYTLARKMFEKRYWRKLLTPTKIYVKPVLEIAKQVSVHGIAHITGGAFSKLTRLNKRFGFLLNNMPKPRGLFRIIMNRMSMLDAYRTFNMGIGMCIILGEKHVDEVMSISKKHRIKALKIGEVIEKPGVYLDGWRIDFG